MPVREVATVQRAERQRSERAIGLRGRGTQWEAA